MLPLLGALNYNTHHANKNSRKSMKKLLKCYLDDLMWIIQSDIPRDLNTYVYSLKKKKYCLKDLKQFFAPKTSTHRPIHIENHNGTVNLANEQKIVNYNQATTSKKRTYSEATDKDIDEDIDEDTDEESEYDSLMMKVFGQTGRSICYWQRMILPFTNIVLQSTTLFAAEKTCHRVLLSPEIFSTATKSKSSEMKRSMLSTDNYVHILTLC